MAIRRSPDDTVQMETPPVDRAPLSLNALIDETQQLLTGFRMLSPSEYRAAAMKMRALSNVSAVWAQRGATD
jgi:hypothetical protein